MLNGPCCRAASIALWVLVMSECESPAGPVGVGERVPVGQVITASVDSADTLRRYSFTTIEGEHAVFLQVLEGTAVLSVMDSARQTVVGGVFGTPASGTLADLSTGSFVAPTGGIYVVSVHAYPSHTTARFEFLVFRASPDPELVPATFLIGDTVTGETIDPGLDYDDFVMTGQAGQEVVAVAEALGPRGSGAVGLVVLDSVTNALLGAVFAPAGSPALTSTGRFRLPTSQDYRFRFRSVIGPFPRYRGAYRFWSYLIHRSPEHRSPNVSVGSEVRGEAIDRAGDVDEFAFQGAAGDELNAFLQASRPFTLEVASATGATLGAVVSAGADTGLFTHASGRFRLPQAGAYTVRVQGNAPELLADTGSFRLFLYPIDRRPEHIPSAIAPGDTISGEAIDLPGDIDEFTFSGAAGDEFNAFFQAQNGSPETTLRVDVLDNSGVVLGSAQSIGTDTSLLRQVTGRFALPSAGTYRLRVSGEQSWNDHDRGAYRLFLYRIDRKPESLPDTLAFGDSLAGEGIDLPGDVDEFRITVPQSSGANLVAELESQSTGTGLSVYLVNRATGATVTAVTLYTAGARTPAGRVLLPPGTYTLRVDASQYADRSILRGAYRIWLYSFSYAPELARDTFAIGDTVSGEAIDPPGDLDVFHFHGVRGQHVNIAFQGLAAPSGGGFQAFITGPTGYSIVFSGTSAAALGDHQTLRVDLPATGWYEIDVSGAGWAGVLAERGPYRLAVEPLGAAPEHVGSALVPGDSVTTEAIDSPGDWDEYMVTASPGQDLGIIVHSSRTDFLYPRLRIFDPITGDNLGETVVYGDRFTGPFRVPASGEVGIAVYEPDGFFRFCYDATCGGVFRFVGAYAFRVIPINRAPENVPATYTVGDTVRGEAIFPAGDIDEFTSSGTPGEMLSPWYRLTASPIPPPGSGITLEVIDPATGAVLIGHGASVIGSTPQYFSPGPFVVPPSGTYLIRVHSGGWFGDELETAPYEFFVKR